MLTREQELAKSRALRAERNAATSRAAGYASDSFRGARLKVGQLGVADAEQPAVAEASDPGIGDKEVNATLVRIADLWDKVGSKEGPGMLAAELPQLLGPGPWDSDRIWEFVFQQANTADGDHAQLVAKLTEFLKAMATPSPQVVEARLGAVAIEKIKSMQSRGDDSKIGLKLRAFAPDAALLASPSDVPLLPTTPEAAAIQRNVQKLIPQILDRDLIDDEQRDLDRFWRRRKLSGQESKFDLLLELAPLLLNDRFNRFFADEREGVVRAEHRRVIKALIGSAMLALGKPQATSDEDIAEVFRVLGGIGIVLSDEEVTGCEEYLWETSYSGYDQLGQTIRAVADRVVRARVAVLKAKAEAPALLSVSEKLRQAAIHDETDRRLRAAEESLDRLDARLRADRERERQELVAVEIEKSRKANPRRYGKQGDNLTG